MIDNFCVHQSFPCHSSSLLAAERTCPRELKKRKEESRLRDSSHGMLATSVNTLFPSYEVWKGPVRSAGSVEDEREEELTYEGESDNEEDDANNELLVNSLLSDENALICLGKNKVTFKNYLRGGKKVRLLRPEEIGFKKSSERYVMIHEPAHRLTSRGFLHPACLMNLSSFDNIDELPEILNGRPLEEDLLARMHAACTDGNVMRLVRELNKVHENDPKSMVQGAFCSFVRRFIEVLQSKCAFKARGHSFCVGGVLADELCAVSGNTDYFAVNEHNDIAFMTLCKEASAHPVEHFFFNGNAGIQLFSAFYSTDFKPTIFYTQKHFILLVKDFRSGRHLKFPEGTGICAVYSLQFVRAIAMCLLVSSPEERGPEKELPPLTFTVTTKACEEVSTAERMMKIALLYEREREQSLSSVERPEEDEHDFLPLTENNLYSLNESFRKRKLEI